MELNGTLELDGKTPSKRLTDCNAPLRLVVKMDRVKRLLTPKNDRAMVSIESVKNARTLFSEILLTINEMQEEDDKVLTQNLKDKVVSLYEVLDSMSKMNISEFDSTQMKDVAMLCSLLCAEVKMAIGRWYQERKFDNDDGSFDGVLDNIVTCCFSNAEFLGL